MPRRTVDSDIPMLPTSPIRRSLQLPWRIAGLWMVVLAMGFAAIGSALALQQVRSLTVRLMAETKFRARQIAKDTRTEFDRQISASLQRLAEHHRTEAQDSWLTPDDWPAWIDGLYIWDGQAVTVVVPASERPEEMANLAEVRFTARWLNRSPFSSPGYVSPYYYYEGIGKLRDVLACLDSRDDSGRSVVIAGRIDHLRI